MNLLVFAGTTEGSDFVCRALACRHTVTASVATEYGAETLLAHVAALAAPDEASFRLRRGRLSASEIASLVPAFDAVVDATHPYAVEVTGHLAGACRAAVPPVPYYRLLRMAEPHPFYRNLHEFDSMDALVAALCARKDAGAIFVATGSHALARLTAVPRYAERLYVRVLPSAESLSACAAAGIPPSHVIAMQGVFSADLNAALFREYGCKVLVTKESGAAGGFPEKLLAAERCGMDVYALVPPKERKEAAYDSAEALLSALEAGRGRT